jgi:hypothetical protein
MVFVRCCNVYVLRSSSYRWRPPTSIDGDSLFMVWAAQAVRPGLSLSLGLPARFIRTLADWLCLYACTACVRYVVVQATETCDSAPGRAISSDDDETGQTAGMNNPNPIQSNPPKADAVRGRAMRAARTSILLRVSCSPARHTGSSAEPSQAGETCRPAAPAVGAGGTAAHFPSAGSSIISAYTATFFCL